MGVIDPNAGVYRGLDLIKEELKELNRKIDLLVSSQSASNIREERNGDFVLKSKGNLVWWTKVDSAARYRMTLIIDSTEVCVLDFDRETRYYVFGNLPNGPYYCVNVVAEDRDGKIITNVSIKL